jgi:hypothetical protein
MECELDYKDLEDFFFLEEVKVRNGFSEIRCKSVLILIFSVFC